MGRRQICQRCLRPTARCLCRHLEGIPPVPNRTGVIILQHPRERLHPLGTAPLVRLGLSNVRLEVAHKLQLELQVPAGTGLLYPSTGAIPLEGLSPDQAPGALLLLDGTWHHARKLLSCNPWLDRLPRYRLTPREPGQYRIRGEPDRDSLSTVEAVVHALRLLEPETGPDLDRLMEAFVAMIDAQVEIIEERCTGSRKRQRYPEPNPLHGRLRGQYGRLLLIYIEAAGADIIQLTAARPATGETLELLTRPEGAPPATWHLHSMGLGSGDLAEGESWDVVRERWLSFLGSRPLVAAWNPRTIKLARQIDPGLPAAETLLLKAAYYNLVRGGGGPLEEIVSKEGLTTEPFPARGRAAQRMADALAILEWLREQS